MNRIQYFSEMFVAVTYCVRHGWWRHRRGSWTPECDDGTVLDLVTPACSTCSRSVQPASETSTSPACRVHSVCMRRVVST